MGVMRYDATANAIEATGLVKRFGKTTALAGVDLVARQGRVLGVLGPNGAGKTTMVRVLATLLRPDDGRAAVCGYDVLREAYQVRQLIGLVGQPRVLFLDEPTTGLDPRSRTDVWAMIRALVADGVTVLLTTQYLGEADQLAHDIVVIDRGQVIATGTPNELKARAGSQVLLVSPSDPGRLAEAAALLEVLAGAEVTTDAEAGTASVPVTDKTLLPRVACELDDRGIELAEFTMRKPSLDEVFFSLTGHKAEDEKPEARDLEETPR